MASWDVFHGDRLELERGLSTAAIRDALARGELRDDDLVRPAGTTVAWGRLGGPSRADGTLAGPPLRPRRPTPVQPAAASRASRPARHRRSHPAAASPVDPQQPGVGTSDFESWPTTMRRSTPAPTLRAPDWFELSAESDDVAFPVIKDLPAEPSFDDRGPSKPAPPGRMALEPAGR